MTNKEHVKWLFEEMKELQNILKDSKAEELSQLEIDLSRDKLKQMYDVLLKLKAVPIAIDKPEEEEIKQDDGAQAPDVGIVLDIEDRFNEIDSASNDIDSDEILTTEPELDMEQEIFQNPEVSSEEVVIDLESEKDVVSEVKVESSEEVIADDVLDLFNETQLPDENKLSTDVENVPIEKETVADKLQKSQLESIKTAIGINEKFFFLNELFSGDLQTYNENIEKLDSQNTLEEAIAFLTELSDQFNWNKESEAMEQITQMLNNKFS